MNSNLFLFYNFHRFIIIVSDTTFIEPTGEVRKIHSGGILAMLRNYEGAGHGRFV